MTNLHSETFKYSLPNVRKSSSSLKLGIYQHSHVPEFTELKNSLPKSPDLNSELFSVGALQQIAQSQNFSNWPAKTCVLIECWAQLILNASTPAIDQLPKRTDDGYECKSWATFYVDFHLNSTYVLMIVDILLYAEWKST